MRMVYCIKTLESKKVKDTESVSLIIILNQKPVQQKIKGLKILTKFQREWYHRKKLRVKE